jgi:hypothetical protein
LQIKELYTHSALGFNGLESLLQISLYILDMFNTHRKPEHVRGNARSPLFLVTQLLVRGSRRLNNEGFGIAHIGKVANQLK